MPSSKNTPQALNKSTDERLLKPNEMSDAKNVTISTDSDGNGFVVKNAKGNAVIAAASGSMYLATKSNPKKNGTCRASSMYL